MNVNRSNYYAYVKAQAIKAEKPQEAIETELKNLFDQHKENYGSRRLLAQLKMKGFKVGRYRVRTLMKKHDLVVKQKLRFKKTTDSQHQNPIAENVLDRQFEVTKPNEVWTTDITYLWTNQGWLYIAIVVDLFSRQIIGWSIQDHMKTSLCINALQMAWFRRGCPKGVLHHSDRGSQYASEEYRNLLKTCQMTQSMSRKGNCWDNSPTERVFRTLKSEWLSRFNFQTKAEAEKEVWSYVSYYNCDRAHSKLGYLSPMAFEEQYDLMKAS